jgi:hypothetical protein
MIRCIPQAYSRPATHGGGQKDSRDRKTIPQRNRGLETGMRMDQVPNLSQHLPATLPQLRVDVSTINHGLCHDGVCDFILQR